jgi:hypothetical protein
MAVMSSSSFFPPPDGDKELQLVNSFESLPQEMVNEILSRLSLSEIITLWRTNTTMQRLINSDANLMLELGVKSLDFFLSELNALKSRDWGDGLSGYVDYTARLEPGLRLVWVLEKKIHLSTAKCLFLTPEKRMREIMGSEEAVASLQVFLEANNLTMAQALAIFSNDWLVILLAEKIITFEQVYNIFIESIKVGGNSKAQRLITCENGAMALREKLITLDDAAQIDDELFALHFTMVMADLLIFRKRHRFLTMENHWQSVGIEKQEDFNKRFYKLPMRWQITVALGIPLSAVENVFSNLNEVKANVNGFASDTFTILGPTRFLMHPQRPHPLESFSQYLDGCPTLLIKLSEDIPDKQNIVHAILNADQEIIHGIFDADTFITEAYQSNDLASIIQSAEKFRFQSSHFENKSYLDPESVSILVRNLANLGKANDINFEKARSRFFSLPIEYQTSILKDECSLSQAEDLCVQLKKLNIWDEQLVSSRSIEERLKFLTIKPEELNEYLKDLRFTKYKESFEKMQAFLNKKPLPDLTPSGLKK